MNSLLRGLAAALAALVLLSQPGCGGSGADSTAAAKKLEIVGVGWYEENVDPSTWTTPPPNGQTAFYDFFVHYTGEIGLGDLRSVRVVAPDGTAWDILRSGAFLDTDAHVIGGWGHWFGSRTNVLPLGDLRVEVTLSDSSVVTARRSVPVPGSLLATGATTMHTEDLLSPPAGSAPMVRRVTMGPATLDGAARSVSLSFSTADPLAYDGWIWLLDGAGTFLGGFHPFRDRATGAVAAQLGGVLRTDGTPNALTVSEADLELVPGASFEQIAKVQVVMTDGKQYVQLMGSGYDCRSVGPVTAFTIR